MDDRFASWAEFVGVDISSVATDQRDTLLARLDAAVAHLYGLSENDLNVIYETFHIGWDFSLRRAAVIEQFKDMA